MNNCNGNGVCGDNGVCTCNDDWGLGDCSALAVPLSSPTYTLKARDYLFFKFAMGGSKVVRIGGDNGNLEFFFTGSKNGPVGDPLNADVVSKAVPGNGKARYMHLSSDRPNGYLTIHNTNYNEAVTFNIVTVPVPVEEVV